MNKWTCLQQGAEANPRTATDALQNESPGSADGRCTTVQAQPQRPVALPAAWASGSQQDFPAQNNDTLKTPCTYLILLFIQGVRCCAVHRHKRRPGQPHVASEPPLGKQPGALC